MGSRKRNSKKKAPESRWQSLLKKPWIFAGAAFGLDLAMLIAGMVLSAAKLPVEYTASGDSIVHSQPLRSSELQRLWWSRFCACLSGLSSAERS